MVCRSQVRILFRHLLRSSSVKDRILWVSLPHLETFYGESPFDLFRSGLRCYDLSEDLTIRPLFSSGKTAEELQQIKAWDQRLTRQADQVFVNSRILFQTKKELNQNTYLVLNGVDLEIFRCSDPVGGMPADLRGIGEPILGFVGGVFDSQVDFDLLRHIASCRPIWHIVLIGPTSGQASIEFQGFPNIHLLGPKPYLELPRYLAHCDVCLGLYKG